MGGRWYGWLTGEETSCANASITSFNDSVDNSVLDSEFNSYGIIDILIIEITFDNDWIHVLHDLPKRYIYGHIKYIILKNHLETKTWSGGIDKVSLPLTGDKGWYHIPTWLCEWTNKIRLGGVDVYYNANRGMVSSNILEYGRPGEVIINYISVYDIEVNPERHKSYSTKHLRW